LAREQRRKPAERHKAAPNPDDVSLEGSSLETLQRWVNDAVKGRVRVSVVEGMMLSVILATRNALADERLLTEAGKIAAVVDAEAKAQSQ
jgi:argininosuccinate synthase